MRSIAGIAVRVATYSLLGGLGLGLVVSPMPASADEPQPGGNPEISFRYQGFDPEQFLGSADPDRIALMDGARTQTMGTYAVGMIFHYGGPPLDICVKDGNNPDSGCKVLGDILNARLRADLGVLYGFGRFDLRLAMPFVLNQSTDFAPSMSEQALSSAGVGNPRVSGRVQIARPMDFGLAFDVAVQIPTGQANFIGDEGLIVDPRLLIDWRHGRFSAGVDVGYRYRQDSAKVANLYLDDEMTWSAAAEVQVLPDKLSIGAAAYGRAGLMNPDIDLTEQNHVISKLGPEEFPAELLGSVRYFVTPSIAVEVGGGGGLTPGYGAAPYRALAGVRLINHKAAASGGFSGSIARGGDKDRDGVTDDEDECPKEKEDADGFQDTDGCPEYDNDEDGRADVEDKCPLAAEDRDGFKDTDGCPDYDNDEDTVSDDEDKCPDEAEDMDGFKDEDGCPDLDTDQDGVADSDDRCIEVAGDAANNGCPVVDTDEDGIFDDKDGCPSDPETVNEIQDEDGCPDATFEVVFDKARVRSASHKQLQALAASLKARGNVKVRIEAHTKDATAALNQERADAVVAFLAKEGVAKARMEAKGFAPSDDASGMVFIIKGDNATAPTPPEPTPTPRPTPPTPTPTPTPTPPAAIADKDGDTVADSADRCPKVKEDVDGFKDDDGCPDPDNDGDSIPDADDRCPDEAGTMANKGCAKPGGGTTPRVTPTPTPTPAPEPEPTPEPEPEPEIEPTPAPPPSGGAEEVFKTMDVVFEVARVRSANKKPMEDLAAALKAKLKADANLKIRVEGRTKDADLKLNQKRADSVVKFLVKLGVPAARISGVGFEPGGDQSGMVFILVQ